MAQYRAGRCYPGEYLPRHFEQVQQLGIPTHGFQVHERGARSIGHIRHMGLAAGQPPDQETVDRTGGDAPAPQQAGNAPGILQQPAVLAAREIRVQHQPGLSLDIFFMPRGAQGFTEIGRASTLPDNGVVQRLTALPVPKQRGLSLVSNADGRDIGRLAHVFTQHRANTLLHRCPDVRRAVFHPPGTRINLRKLEIDARAQPAASIHQGHGTARGALIDGENEPGHGYWP